jgi:predicted membrane protein
MQRKPKENQTTNNFFILLFFLLFVVAFFFYIYVFVLLFFLLFLVNAKKTQGKPKKPKKPKSQNPKTPKTFKKTKKTKKTIKTKAFGKSEPQTLRNLWFGLFFKVCVCFLLFQSQTIKRPRGDPYLFVGFPLAKNK